MPETINKIQSLSIKNFTCFDKLNLNFSSGINVLIGKNGVGKTHILKLLYSIFEGIKRFNNPNKTIEKDLFGFELSFTDSVYDFFKVDNLLELCRNFDETTKLHYKFNIEEFNIEANPNDIEELFRLSEINNTNFNPQSPIISTTYLPPQEILTISSDLKFFCETYENTYDQTYYNLAKALEVPKLKNKGNFENIVKDLLNEIGGNIEKQDKNFYINFKDKKITASLLAEGIKKIATIQYLLENGTITKNSVLLWDEPEVHLNPKMIPVLVKLIQKLANSGVQIFIASHDHLLTQQLSMLSEYNQVINAETAENVPDMTFFVLYENQDKSISCEQGENLTQISYNPILEEFVNLHDNEQYYFDKSFSVK